jgi:hypothetical protein
VKRPPGSRSGLKIKKPIGTSRKHEAQGGENKRGYGDVCKIAGGLAFDLSRCVGRLAGGSALDRG